MTWRCGECGRTHDDPPETCVCGSADVGPDAGDDGESSRLSLLALRQRLLDPRNADRSLVREEPYVALAFRVLVVGVLLGFVLLAFVLLV